MIMHHPPFLFFCLLGFLPLLCATEEEKSAREWELLCSRLKEKSTLLVPVPSAWPPAVSGRDMPSFGIDREEHFVIGSYPVSLYFDSRTLQGGIFGPAWRSPQLESSVAWQGNRLTWNTPWGERLEFDCRSDEPIRGEKGAWKLAFAQAGFPHLTVLAMSQGTRGCSFLYRTGLLRRIERDGLPPLIFEYAGRKLVRVRLLSSVLLALEYENGRVCRLGKCHVCYGNARVGILSSDGTRVAATQVLPVLQGWIDERERTLLRLEYASPDYLPQVKRTWLPGYPQGYHVQNEAPFRRDFEQFMSVFS